MQRNASDERRIIPLRNIPASLSRVSHPVKLTRLWPKLSSAKKEIIGNRETGAANLAHERMKARKKK
jgi:hypothetical protein